MTKKVRFLIVRFSSIGDIVLTTPVIRGLKQQVEGAEVHFVTKKVYYDVIKHNPYIDKIHLFDREFTTLIEDLRNEYFDYVIDLHHNLRTYRLKNKLGAMAFSFDKINWPKFVIVNFNKNILPKVHIVDRYMDTVKVFDVNDDKHGLDYFISDEDKIDLSKYGLKANDYTALVIGATHTTKRLPNEKLISIIKQIKGSIVLLGGKTDSENAKAICTEINSERVIDTCGLLKLNESAYIVQQARVVVSHDTGLMHIAAAYKKKIVSVWGNTIPEFGMYPYFADEASAIIEVKDLKCRPCTKIGFSGCPKKHFKCMNNIDEAKIAELCNQ